jgi:archaellin
MRLPQRRGAIIGAAVAVAMAIGGGAYAFTASNTVPATSAGAGTGVVSGYTVTNLHYSLDATTPTNIDSLTFTISPETSVGPVSEG